MDDVQMAGTVAAATGATHLEMRWAPVADAQGRTRMEAVWIETGASPALTAHPAA